MSTKILQYRWLILLSFLCFLNSAFSQTEGFVLCGSFPAVADGTSVYLLQYSTKDTVARSSIRNGKFVLNGNVPNGTEYYYLRMDSLVSKKRSKEFLLVNKLIQLETNFSYWPAVFITGSQPHAEYQLFVQMWDELTLPITQIKKLQSKHQGNIDSLKDVLSALEKKRILKIQSFINERTGSIYIADVITRLQGEFSDQQFETFYTRLTTSAKKSFFGSILKREIELVKVRKRVKEGALIPDFVLPGLDQKYSGILNYASKNKLTLIDFWASWCPPCRAQIPSIKKVYETYHKQGFDVIAIALNDKSEDWKKALAKEETPWTNVRDENNELYNLFYVTQIPAYILIDDKGRLISFYCQNSVIPNFGPPLKGEELSHTIDTLLKNLKTN